jgi:hypothetical protein
MPEENKTIEQRITEAVVKYAESVGNTPCTPLDDLLGTIVAAIAELDARTHHVQR